MQLLLSLLLSVVLSVALAGQGEKSTEQRNLVRRAPYYSVPKLPEGLSLVNGQCVYKVKAGDALIKIANKFQQFLAFPLGEDGTPTKDCLQCPGYAEQCAIPTWQNSRSGHLGDYIQLWQANGACNAGKMDVNKIRVGDTLVIPNCPLSPPPPTLAPTRRPPTQKPSKLRGFPPSPAPSDQDTDDTFDHVVKAVKDKVREWVGTAAPTPKPVKVKTPEPSYKKPDEDDTYYTA
jgi:hypothetical protein